jgi:hypothetical protein
MPPILTICADCERHALRFPKRGKAMTEALACLTRLLLDRKRLQGLEVVRKQCLQNCPLGRICVALKCGDQEVRHHLSPEDDLKKVAAKLAGTLKP